MGALNGSSACRSPRWKSGKTEQLRFWKTASRSAWSAWKAIAHGVDTPEDLEIIRELLAEHTCKSCVR